MTVFARFLSILLLTVGLAACGGSDGSGDSSAATPPPDTTPTTPGTPTVISGARTVTLSTDTYVASTLSQTSVGPAGAVITVTGAGDPLAGAVVSIPAGALREPVNLSLSSAAVTSADGLPDGAAPRSRAIRVQMSKVASGAAVGSLPKLVRITLPVDTSSTDAIGYYQVENGGVLEAMGFESIDATTRAITFVSRAPSTTGTVAGVGGVPLAGAGGRVHALDATSLPALYATYLAVGVSQVTLLNLSASHAAIESGFKPSRNGFAQPNIGSYYGASRGGNCTGMVAFAKYYYQMGFPAPLVDTYRDAQKTETFVDDAVAIELASRVQNEIADIWADYQAEIAVQTSANAVGNGFVGALYVTGRPALMYLQQIVEGQPHAPHAVLVYRAEYLEEGYVAFDLYDPNDEKVDTHGVLWVPGVGGEFLNYDSATAAGEPPISYNYFRQIGFALGVTPDELARDKADADAGYPASQFPTITITSITGKTLGDDALANTGTTPAGFTDYKTGDTAVVIEGTVLGGNAQVAGQVVNTLNIYYPDGERLLQAAIDNQAGGGSGKFRVVVPIKAGINAIALLASDPNTLEHWAGFKQLFVESTAAPSYFTATLTWNQGTSDIDIYVKEPDGAAGTADAGKTGDIVFFAHRNGASTTNAYLDFDNTDGYGPENYIVKPGLKTAFTDGTSALSANGTYTLAVHYFSWNGEADAPDRSVGWTVKWRLLKSCNNNCANPETDGLWVTGSQSGTLASDDDGSAGPDGFYAGGAAWSSKFQIAFPPATTSWSVPPSNTIMLP